MVTARYLSSKFVTPIVERRRAEGRAEMHNAWLAWYRKSEDAKARGYRSTKPPARAAYRYGQEWRGRVRL